MATQPFIPAPAVYLADPACSWGCDHCEVMCATLAVIAGNLERELDAMMTGLPPVPSATQQAALVAKAERLQAYSSALDETRASRAGARGQGPYPACRGAGAGGDEAGTGAGRAQPALMATETCAGCRFFTAGTTTAFPNAHGMCRRYAPTGPVIGSHADGFQLFPPMMAHHWCGDFRPEPVRGNAMRAAA